MRSPFVSILFLLAVLLPQVADAGDICLECHGEKTPGIVRHWEGSAHYKAGVGCSSCHGTDTTASHNRTATVSAAVCGRCHKEPLVEHRLSRHGSGLKTGRGCTRNMEKTEENLKSCSLCHEAGSTKPLEKAECAMFLAQSPEMRRQGCDSCHRVEDRCDTCHSRHGTDLSLARAPGTCGTCHMGPDHAQYEMWDASAHGVVFRTRGEKEGPSCASCHMAGGSHNVSKGIASGLPADSAVRKEQRDFMVRTCSACHTGSFAARNLGDADRIEEQSSNLVKEAQTLIEELSKEGLLAPAPSERPPHPLFGRSFVIGPHMLYEDLSRAEAEFFRMKQFYYMNAVKGAFHQNPDYTHWYGNAPLKLALSEIKSEALSLRKIKTLESRLENALRRGEMEKDEAPGIRKTLRGLKDRRLRGDITEKEYRVLKEKALKDSGL